MVAIRILALALTMPAPVAAATTSPVARAAQTPLAPVNAAGVFDGWRPSMALAVGWVFAPTHIGRDINATGGEELLARLGDRPLSGIRLGAENGPLGFEVGLTQHVVAIQVENEFGTEFPNHGRPPLRYAVAAVLLPLAPLRGTAFGRHVQPFVKAGIGGWLVSVDLDNVHDQTFYHLWAPDIGGGVRVFPRGGEFFIDVRFERSWVAGRGPIARFRADVLTVAFGATP